MVASARVREGRVMRYRTGYYSIALMRRSVQMTVLSAPTIYDRLVLGATFTALLIMHARSTLLVLPELLIEVLPYS